MTEERRKDIERMLAKLRTLWCVYPELRLGQLVDNLAYPASDAFYISDDEMDERMDTVIVEGWQ